MVAFCAYQTDRARSDRARWGRFGLKYNGLADRQVGLPDCSGLFAWAGENDFAGIVARWPCSTRPIHIDIEPLGAWSLIIGLINYKVAMPALAGRGLQAQPDDVAVIGPDQIGPEIKSGACAGQFGFLAIAALDIGCVRARH